MSNPLLGFIDDKSQITNGFEGNRVNPAQFVQQLNNFKKSFYEKNVNPKTIVNQMLQSGKINKQMFEEAKSFASQIENLLSK